MRQKIVTTLYYALVFFDTPDFLTYWSACSPQSFSTPWSKKNLTENRDVPPPSYSQFLFHARNFLKHRGVASRIFSVQRDKKFSTKNCDNPLLCIKFLTHWKAPHEVFGQCETVSFSKENCDTPHPHIDNFSYIPEIFWNIKKVPDDVFRHCETKLFWQKLVIPPAFSSIPFGIPEFFWNTKMFRYKFSRFCQKNVFSWKLWFLALSYPSTFLHTIKFLKNRRLPLRISLVLWDKKFWSKNHDNPLLWIEFIRYPKVSDTLKGSPRNFSTLWGKKNFDKKSWYPPISYPYILSYQNCFQTQKSSPTSFSELSQQNFLRKIVIPRPLLSINFFPYHKFSEEKKGSFTNLFGRLRQKKFGE